MIALALLAAAAAGPLDWVGTWEGPMVNLPGRPGAPAIRVTAEFGGWPDADGACTTLRNTYRRKGKVEGVKDYKLCRGKGADDLFVDEGDGVRLASRLLSDVLVTPFKYDDRLLITTTRVRGQVMEQEIVSIADKPAGKGVVELAALSVQRLTMRRVSRRVAR